MKCRVWASEQQIQIQVSVYKKKKACLAKSASLESHMTNVLVVCQISLLVNHITAAPISQRHADVFRCTNFWCDMNLRQHGDKKQKALGS